VTAKRNRETDIVVL